MHCPKCTSEKLSVVDSRSDGDAIRRRRECQDCDFRFTTFERVELTLPLVVKKDGRRELFNRDKVRSGIMRACEKRPVSMEEIDRLVDNIEQKINNMCEKEVSGQTIGKIVMEELQSLDQIAYVRFASVYREFSDISQFVETLKNLVDVKGAIPVVSDKKKVVGG
ncbi:MAG: transcriptional repressor NrdR [Bdellovibrionales bacterium]|nr:transcriptional repressor NrdR [Bdellovibrionales bacterium]